MNRFVLLIVIAMLAACSADAFVGVEHRFRKVSGTCALADDGALFCWGNAVDDRAGAPPTQILPLSRWKDVSNSLGHVCAIREEGSLWCWGQWRSDTDEPGPLRVGADADWIAVASGQRQTCGLRAPGTLWCWGDGTLGGPLSAFGAESIDTPQALSSDADFTALSLGWGVGCAVKADHSLWCWGDDGGQTIPWPVHVGGDNDWVEPEVSTAPCARKQSGALACGTFPGWSTMPFAPTAPGAWASLATGGLFGESSCAINSAERLFCWGSNEYGQLGDGTVLDRAAPGPVASEDTWQSVSVRASSTCGIKSDGSLWCWGDRSYGVLGDGILLPHASAPVSLGHGWAGAWCGYEHTCALRTDGTMACWGDPGGNGSGRPAMSPVPAPLAIAWREAVAGLAYTCAIDHTDHAWCWGQLASWIPQPIAPDRTWRHLGSGVEHVCGIAGDGGLWCWGDNSRGQLGDGTTTSRDLTPVRIHDGGATWLDVDGGFDSTCAVRADHTLWCWGWQPYYFASSDTDISHADLVPVQIGSGTSWLRVAMEGQTVCALDEDGSLWCWGQGSAVGPGVEQSELPRRIPGGEQWTDVAVGITSACALAQGGALFCWGRNDLGQLGDGSDAPRSELVQVGSATDWVQLSAKGWHTCAIKADSSLWCWGRNDDGQLGNGQAWQLTPERVEIP